MAELREETVLTQITILLEQSAINVQWENRVIRDEEIISKVPIRKAYTPEDIEAFMSEVHDAELYIQAAGWLVE